MTDSAVKLPLPSQVYSWVIFLLPALALTTRHGVGIAEVACLFGALYFAKPLYAQRRELYAPAKWIVLAFALYFAVALASLLWFGFRFSGIDNPLRQFLATAAIGLIAFARPDSIRLWQGMVVGSVGAAAFALYQSFVLGLERADGFRNAIMFGDIAMAMGLMSLAAVPVLARTRWAAMPYLAFLCGCLSAVLSATRGAWIAVVLCAVPYYFSAAPRFARRSLALVVACVIGAIAFSYASPSFDPVERVAEISSDIAHYRAGDSFSSTGQRLEMWQGAAIMFAEHPLFGVGRTNFRPALREQITKGKIDASVAGFTHAHNEILHAMATGGIIGAAALLAVYLAPLVFFWRGARRRDAGLPFALAGLTLVLAFILFGMTQVLFAHHIGAAFYALMISILAGLYLMTQRVES